MKKAFPASEAEEVIELYRAHGMSTETESSWQDALSEAHRGYILAYIEFEQAREAAVIDRFFGG